MKKIITIGLLLSTVLSSVHASQVDKVRVYCEASGKYVSNFVGSHKAICQSIFTYNYESKDIDGSFSCRSNKGLLLISGEITKENSSVNVEEVVIVKRNSTIIKNVPILTYSDKHFKLKTGLDASRIGDNSKYSNPALITLNNESFKTKCIAVEGTRNN